MRICQLTPSYGLALLDDVVEVDRHMRNNALDPRLCVWSDERIEAPPRCATVAVARAMPCVNSRAVAILPRVRNAASATTAMPAVTLANTRRRACRALPAVSGALGPQAETDSHF